MLFLAGRFRQQKNPCDGDYISQSYPDNPCRVDNSDFDKIERRHELRRRHGQAWPGAPPVSLICRRNSFQRPINASFDPSPPTKVVESLSGPMREKVTGPWNRRAPQAYRRRSLSRGGTRCRILNSCTIAGF